VELSELLRLATNENSVARDSSLQSVTAVIFSGAAIRFEPVECITGPRCQATKYR
jgi:hypothetical protein